MKVAVLAFLILLLHGVLPAQISTSSKRDEAEKVARQLKLQGLLKEQGNGLIDVVKDPLRSEVDNERLRKASKSLNELRQDYFKGRSSEAVEGYARRIREQDEREVIGKTGAILLRVGCPPSLSQTLVPALIKGFLGEIHGCSGVGSLVWDDKQRQYGSVAAGKFACVIVQTESAKSLATALEAGKLDLVVGYGPLGEIKSTGETIALDGLAIIVHPRSRLSSCSANSPLAQLGSVTSWVGVEDEADCAIPGLKLTLGTSFATFEAVEDRVFKDRHCAAVVPLGMASFTDNKLLRIDTKSGTEPQGYYPTQLTVARGLYPWIRPVLLKQRKSASEEMGSFARFVAGDVAKAIILKAGYATN